MAGNYFTGKRADPEWRRERSRKGARARNEPDYHIHKLESSALTAEQIARLTALVAALLAARGDAA